MTVSSLPFVTNLASDNPSTMEHSVSLTDKEILVSQFVSNLLLSEQQAVENGRTYSMAWNPADVEAILKLERETSPLLREFNDEQINRVSIDIASLHGAVLKIVNDDNRSHEPDLFNPELFEKLNDENVKRDVLSAYEIVLNNIRRVMPDDAQVASLGIHANDIPIEVWGRVMQLLRSGSVSKTSKEEESSVVRAGGRPPYIVVATLAALVVIVASGAFKKDGFIGKFLAGIGDSGKPPASTPVSPENIIQPQNISGGDGDSGGPEPQPEVTLMPTQNFDTYLNPILTPTGLTVDQFKEINNLDYSNEGVVLTFQTEQQDETIFLTHEDLKSRMFVLDQGNVIQILDPTLTKVEYAYDSSANEFLRASDYIRWPVNVENAITLSSYEEMESLWTKEALFMRPFDSNKVYVPDSNVINLDWSRDRIPPGSNVYDDYGSFLPLGVKPDGTDSFVRLVNFHILDAGSGPPMIVLTQQVYNWADGTFSLMRLTPPLGGDLKSETSLKVIIEKTQHPNAYLLPTLDFDAIKGLPRMPGYSRYLAEKGLNHNDLNPAILRWIQTGKFPSELEYILMASETCYWAR